MTIPDYRGAAELIRSWGHIKQTIIGGGTQFGKVCINGALIAATYNLTQEELELFIDDNCAYEFDHDPLLLSILQDQFPEVMERHSEDNCSCLNRRTPNHSHLWLFNDYFESTAEDMIRCLEKAAIQAEEILA